MKAKKILSLVLTLSVVVMLFSGIIVNAGTTSVLPRYYDFETAAQATDGTIDLTKNKDMTADAAIVDFAGLSRSTKALEMPVDFTAPGWKEAYVQLNGTAGDFASLRTIQFDLFVPADTGLGSYNQGWLMFAPTVVYPDTTEGAASDAKKTVDGYFRDIGSVSDEINQKYPGLRPLIPTPKTVNGVAYLRYHVTYDIAPDFVAELAKAETLRLRVAGNTCPIEGAFYLDNILLTSNDASYDFEGNTSGVTAPKANAMTADGSIKTITFGDGATTKAMELPVVYDGSLGWQESSIEFATPNGSLAGIRNLVYDLYVPQEHEPGMYGQSWLSYIVDGIDTHSPNPDPTKPNVVVTSGMLDGGSLDQAVNDGNVGLHPVYPTAVKIDGVDYFKFHMVTDISATADFTNADVVKLRIAGNSLTVSGNLYVDNVVFSGMNLPGREVPVDTTKPTEDTGKDTTTTDNTTDTTNNPKTGDSSVLFLMTLILASGTAAYVCYRNLKPGKQQ